MNKFFSELSGRSLFILLLIAIGSGCALLAYIMDHSVMWSIWNIPTMTPHFADLRVFTGVITSIEAGYDPLFNNPGDPWGRELNHPRIVQTIIVALGIREAHTTTIGLMMISLFVLSLIYSMNYYGKLTTLILIIVTFSPATMLGIERANNDLLMFAMVAFAIILSRLSGLITSSAILVSAALKLFPIFSILLLMRYQKSKFLIYSALTGVIFLGYLYANFNDLPQILSSTQKGVTVFSYGSRSYSLEVGLIPAMLPCLIVLFINVIFFLTAKYHDSFEKQLNSYNLDAFRVGAGIYIGTFFLGNNWSYRLIFVIFTIPCLVECLRKPPLKIWGYITLASIIFSFWSIRFDDIPLSGALDEATNWLMLSGLFWILLNSIPIYLRPSKLRRRNENQKHFRNS